MYNVWECPETALEEMTPAFQLISWWEKYYQEGEDF